MNIFKFSQTPYAVMPPNLTWSISTTDQGWFKVIACTGEQSVHDFGSAPTSHLMLRKMEKDGFKPETMPPEWQAYIPMTNLTAKEAAELLGVKPQKISRACGKEIILCHRDSNGKLYIHAEGDLLDLLLSLENCGKAKIKKKSSIKCPNCDRGNIGRRSATKKILVCNDCRYEFISC